MSSQTLAVLTMAVGIVSVVLSGWFSLRTAQSRNHFELEKDKRVQQQSALRAAQSVYEPLALAAAELQSKIYNIVKAAHAGHVSRYAQRDDYPEVSTAYFFASYLGWIEARREAILASAGMANETSRSSGSSDACAKHSDAMSWVTVSPSSPQSREASVK